MRTILVDDEEGARGHLAELLVAHKIDIIAQADHPLKAIELINQLSPDLVLLDIQMPLLDGFEMLPYLKVQPIIIFCTAHDSYALQAFEVNALDYLLKPVTPERLEMALTRAANEWEKLESIKMMEPRSDGLRKLICRRGEANHVVWLRDILVLNKEGRYTAVSTRQGEHYLTDLTIDYLDRKITHPHFFRINRGIILHRDHVRDFTSQTHGSGQVKTADDQELTISRSRFPAFKAWIGHA